MIIKRVTIRNWRGLDKFEAQLSPALNLLCGVNEAGKSSVVEAITWALQRDVMSGARLKQEIAPIIPMHNPTACPRVELLLVFPGGQAAIRKTLGSDSSHRECRLIVRREGEADQTFLGSEAQARIKTLLESDGAPEAANVDVSLLISAQAQSTRFVSEDLSASARAGIAVGTSGAIAPTSRLESVRAALEKKRGRELFEKLKANAVDSAKKPTEAAQARDRLASLREERAKFDGVLAQIAALRAQIEELKSERDQLESHAKELQSEVEDLRSRQSAQREAAREAAEKRRAHEEAKRRRDELQRNVEEIERLSHDRERSAQAAEELRQQLEEASAQKAQWQSATDAAWREHVEAENLWKEARRQGEAWERCLAVCASRRERKRLKIQLEQREQITSEVASHKAALENLGRAPSRGQIARWQEQFYALEAARHQAEQSLRVALKLEQEYLLRLRADGGAVEEIAAPAGEEIVIGAWAGLDFQLPGVGRVRVQGAAREAQKQSNDVEAKLRHLEKELANFNVRLDELPGAFERLASQCAAWEEASQNLKFAERQAQTSTVGASIRVGQDALQDLRAELAEADARWQQARGAAEPFRGLLPSEINESKAAFERERAREEEAQKQAASEAARRKWEKTFKQLTEYSQRVASLEAQLASLEETGAQSEARLLELGRDGLDDAARQVVLEELNATLWQARNERDEAIKVEEGLGERIADETLARLARESEDAKAKVHRLERELADRRATLRGFCEQDPQTEIARLDFEIEQGALEVEKHEARLRGLAILEAALEAERHRLGRAIAEPLNEKLSPWLSELRGQPTAVEFDEDTGRITGIRSQRKASRAENGSAPSGETTHVLPFISHSGGMQEQTALALRLIVAVRAAQKLPSGRLPLVLDDPLTQSDTMRREGLWRVLREASQHLQILFVTCHETHLPNEIEAHRIILGDWQEKSVAPPVAEKEITIEKPKRKTKKAKAETNGHQEKAEAETLSLW